MIKNIIFDWSGTLVDDLEAVWLATNYIFRQAGLKEISLETFRREFCLPFTNFYRKYTPHIPMEQLEEWFHCSFRISQDKVKPIKYAKEFLLFCKENNIKTCVLSSVHPDYYAYQTKMAGLDGLIDSAYVGVWDKRGKIKELLIENKYEPSETIFVGDMEHDVETARCGGVFSCAVMTGYNHLDILRGVAPDLIVENLAELQEILSRSKFDIHSYLQRSSTRWMKPVVTVGALIFNEDGKVLLVKTHKWSNLWGIPGGKIKFGEPSEEALRREIKEETGLDVDSIRFVMVQDCIHSDEFYRDEHFVLLNYVCKCVNNAPVVLNEEAQDYKWVSIEEAFKLPLNKPTYILLRKVQNEVR